MSLIFFLSALFLLAAADSNDGDPQRSDRIETEDARDDAIAYESFGSPVYGPSAAAVAKSGGVPPPGKSAYSVPAPPAFPAAYAGYLNSLGYANPYAFNRFGVMPYAAPYAYGAPYGYGAYGALPYGGLGYGGALAGGLGYPAGLPYSPYMGRASLNVLGYPGPAGLGYRFGGLASAGYRGVPLPAPLPPPAPVAAPAAPIPPPPPVRAPVATTVGKDGTLRYAYPPLQGQKIPGY
ncbi:unnamed protein product [Larinioides sclopetarius]|uniref:Uncharacterized protein n=1 Tax=Larinioides sclopetarius TaxID=280406 RepID=A0AAV1Z0V8_9ARAC